MVASAANPGFGITLGIGDGASSEVFTNLLSEIISVGGVGTSHNVVEVTHMSSTGGWREYLGTGVKEGKEFTVNVNFVADQANQITLYQTRVEAGSKNNYQLTFTDDGSSTLTFSAIVSDIDISHERDSQAQATITFRPSGAYTWA